MKTLRILFFSCLCAATYAPPLASIASEAPLFQQDLQSSSAGKLSSDELQEYQKELQLIEPMLFQDPNEAKVSIEWLRAIIPTDQPQLTIWLDSLDCQLKVSLGEYQASKQVAMQALEKYQDFSHTTHFVDLVICKGLSLEYLSEVKLALESFNRAVTLAKASQSSELIADAYRARGDFYVEFGTIDSALDDLQTAYRFAEKANDEPLLMLVRNSLANLYSYLSDFDTAIEQYLQVYQFAKSQDNKTEIAVVTFNLAQAYLKTGDLVKAKDFFTESLEVSLEINDKPGVAFSLAGLGQIAIDQNNDEIAEIQITKSQKIFEEIGEVFQVAQGNIQLAELYRNQKQYDKSIDKLNTALSTFNSAEYESYAAIVYRDLATTYAEMGNFEKAFTAHKSYFSLYERANQNESNRRVDDMRTAFDVAQKESLNELLSEKNRRAELLLEKQSQVNQFQNWLLFLSGLLVLTMTLQIWRYIRNKKELEVLARTDELTELANRRHIMEFIDNEFDRAQRDEPEFSLVMFDIDYFKQFNDRYGHKVGDRVLQTVAKSCKSLLRKSDILGRVGGEEFLLFLPHTNIDEAMLIAERCRKKVSKIPTPLVGEEEKITISCGVVAFDNNMKSVDDMLNKVDIALYQAKKLGRNQSCLAE